MKKFYCLCLSALAYTTALAGADTESGRWDSATIQGKTIQCNGVKKYENFLEGDIVDGTVFCLQKGNAKKALWLADFTTDYSKNPFGVKVFYFGENCAIKNPLKDTWTCQKKQVLKAGDIQFKVGKRSIQYR